MVPPKILDYKSLCIPDDQPGPPEQLILNPTNWDDIFWILIDHKILY